MEATVAASVGGTSVPGAVSVRLLGSLEVEFEGRSLVVPRGRSRQLLALCARRPGIGRGVHELCDQLWYSELPEGPKQALRVTVSRLRDALGAGASALRTLGDAYVLDAWVDGVELASLVRRAGTAPDDTALVMLEQARELWRGSPLVDVDACPEVDQWTAELCSLRDLADGALAEVYLRLGRLDEAIALGRQLVARLPHDERAVRCLATALARGGYRSDALRAVEALRSVLRTELGIDPSDAVQQVERDILIGHVDLSPLTVNGRAVNRFVGRSDLVERILGADTNDPVLVVGESGVGKSAVARELGERMSERSGSAGRSVLVAAQPRQARPLEPIRALVSQLRGNDAGAEPVEAELPDDVATLEQLVDHLTGAVCALASHEVTILVDDAHWLDRTSAKVLDAVAERSGAWLVLFARSEGILRSLPNTARRARVLHLGAFSGDEVEAFVRANYPRLAAPEMVELLARRSGGNAMFLSLLADSISEGQMVGKELPVTLLLAAAERVQALPDGAQRALEIGAIVGDEFDAPLVASIDPEAVPQLAHAEEAGLLDRSGDVFRFRHGVIAEAVRQMMVPVRRVDLCDAIGERLSASGAAATAYVHLFEATVELDPLRAVRACLDAGAIQERVFAHEEALDLFGRAVELTTRDGESWLRWRALALVRLGSLQRRSGEPQHEQTLRLAAETARDVDVDCFVDAVIELCGHGRSTVGGDVDDTTSALLTDALERCQDRSRMALLCSAAATTLSFSQQQARVRPLFRTAWATASELGDPELEAQVLMNSHLGLQHPDDLEQRRLAASRLRALAGDDADRLWECAFLEFVDAAIHADLARVGAAMDELRSIDRLPKHRPRDFGMAFTEAAYAQLEGRLDDAHAHAERALAIGSARYSPTWAFGVYMMLELAIRDGRGDYAGMSSMVEHTLAQMPAMRGLRCPAAYARMRLGDRSAAVRHLAEVFIDGRLAIGKDLAWSGAAYWAGLAAAGVGDPKRSAIVAAALAPWRGRMAWFGVTTPGPVDAALDALSDVLTNRQEQR